MRFMPTRVSTLDAHKSPGRPTRFLVGDVMLDVTGVRRHWYVAYTDPSFHPDEYFSVVASDEKVYVLRYSTLFSSWWVREEEPGRP